MSRTKNLSLKAVVILFIGISAAAANAKTLSSESAEDITKQMVAWQEAYALPSFSMAIALDGELVFANAIGFSDVENKIEAAPDTLYSVGSIAKPMTALALAKLVDRGTLSLANSVTDTVPELPQFEQISLLQLASHTAGIGRPWEARNALEFEKTKDHKSPFEVLPIFVDKSLSFQPGSSFEYTSMGYVLLSAVLEQATPKSYTELMEQQVFGPLGMTNTLLDDSTVSKQREAKYYKKAADTQAFIAADEKRDRSFLFGAGGYVSTPTDLVKMASAFSDQEFISSEIQQKLMTPVKIQSGEINPQRYGIGWRVSEVEIPNSNGEKTTAIHHGGVTGGAATGFVLIIPEFKASIAYVTNTDPDEFWQVRQEALTLLLRLVKAPKTL